MGLGDNLACDQSAARQGPDLLLGLHSNTKSARQKHRGADLHQGTRFLLRLWGSPVPRCCSSMCTLRDRWGWDMKDHRAPESAFVICRATSPRGAACGTWQNTSPKEGTGNLCYVQRVGAGRLGIGALVKLGAVCTSAVTFRGEGDSGSRCLLQNQQPRCCLLAMLPKQAPAEAGGRLAGNTSQRATATGKPRHRPAQMLLPPAGASDSSSAVSVPHT